MSYNHTWTHRRHRTWFEGFWLGALCFLLANAALAQDANPAATNVSADLTLEQLVNIRVESVFGASKFEQKVTQAPASVSIVTSDEFKKLGARNLADVLQSVRSLYVTSDRNYSYLGVRGFARPSDYNTRVLLLVNGHRVNDNIFDSWFLGNDAIVDLDMIDRVEVIRGPSSSIYGNSAFLGVINLITKHGSAIDGVEASGEAGSFDSYKGRFNYGKRFANEIELVLSGSFYDSAGERSLYYPEFDQRISSDPRATNNGIARNSDGERAYNVFGSISYHDLTLSGAFSDRRKEVPTASFGTVFNDGREATTDIRGYVDLTYDHEFDNDFRVTGRVGYDQYNYYGDYPYANPAPPPDAILNKDYSLGQWLDAEFQLTKKIFDRHTLILGTEYRDNLRQYQINYDQDPRLDYFRSDHGSRNFGLYAQGEVAVLTNLLLNAGVRYDDYDTFGGTVNPRCGVIFAPWQPTAFKFLYGQAFRAPNDFELHYESPTALSNPNLEPETIRTYELVYEQYLGSNHRFTLAGYHYSIDNLISQTTDAASGKAVFRNLQQAEANGLELELEGRYARGTVVRGSYTVQRTEDAQTGLELSNSPRHLAKLNLIVPLYRDKLFSGQELQYHGGARTLSGNRIDDFVILNWTLFSQKLAKGLEISASVYNLLNTHYAYPGSADHLQDVLAQDGRNFRVKVTYRF